MEVDNRIKKIKEFLEEQKSLIDLMEEVSFDWNALGLTQWLDEASANLLKSKLNEIVRILLNSNMDFDKRLDTLMIPIVFRAFKIYGHLVNNCMSAIIHVNLKIYLLPKEGWDYKRIDMEAEFCDLMAKEISELKL